MKEEIENLLRTERDRHLINIGLIDKEKSDRVYQDNYSAEFPKYDTEKRKYYKGNIVPLNVTDDEYIEICKYFPPSKVGVKSSEVDIKSAAETILRVIATIVLVFGILGAIICLIMIIDFGPVFLLGALGFLLFTLPVWAVLSVLSNISISLKEINSKT